MYEYLIKCLAILFVSIGPIDNGALYAGLTHAHTPKERRDMALKATILATAVLFLFPVLGDMVFKTMGLGLYALQISGGILLLILSIQIVMGEYESGQDMSKRLGHKDFSVFPLGIPLIAGPAAITQSMVLIGEAGSDFGKKTMVYVALGILMVFSYVMLLAGGLITRLLSDKGAEMFARILGIFLAAISVDLIVRGIKVSGLFQAVILP